MYLHKLWSPVFEITKKVTFSKYLNFECALVWILKKHVQLSSMYCIFLTCFSGFILHIFVYEWIYIQYVPIITEFFLNTDKSVMCCSSVLLTSRLTPFTQTPGSTGRQQLIPPLKNWSMFHFNEFKTLWGKEKSILVTCLDWIKTKNFDITDLSLGLVSGPHHLSHVHKNLHHLSFIVQLLLHGLTTAVSQCCLDLLEPALIVWVIMSVCQEPVHTYKQH